METFPNTPKTPKVPDIPKKLQKKFPDAHPFDRFIDSYGSNRLNRALRRFHTLQKNQSEVLEATDIDPDLHQKAQGAERSINQLTFDHSQYVERRQRSPARQTVERVVVELNKYIVVHTMSVTDGHRRRMNSQQELRRAKDDTDALRSAQASSSNATFADDPLLVPLIQTRIDSPTNDEPTPRRVEFQSQKPLNATERCLDSVISWLERVSRIQCCHWLVDASDAVRSSAMMRVVAAFEAFEAPGSYIPFLEDQARENIQSTLVLDIARDVCRTIEPFRRVWDDKYSQGPLALPQSIKSQVHELLVDTFKEIPVIQRKAILFMVEGLEYCDDQALDQVFECFETCVRNLPVCFLVSSLPQRSIQRRLQRLSFACMAGPRSN